MRDVINPNSEQVENKELQIKNSNYVLLYKDAEYMLEYIVINSQITTFSPFLCSFPCSFPSWGHHPQSWVFAGTSPSVVPRRHSH